MHNVIIYFNNSSNDSNDTIEIPIIFITNIFHYYMSAHYKFSNKYIYNIIPVKSEKRNKNQLIHNAEIACENDLN